MLFIQSTSQTDVLLFTKHLATMVKAGIPIVSALEIISQHTAPRYLKPRITSILQDVSNGQSLSESMGEHPHIFRNLYLNLITIGEESGTLEDSLQFLAQQLQKELQLRRKIRSALLYPGLVLSATIAMGAILAFFILPQLVTFFTAFETELPLSTKILIAIAEFIKSYGLFAGIAIGVSMAGAVGLLQFRPIRFTWHRLKIHLPLIGKLLRTGEYAHFCRNFGVLLQSGVPAAKSLEIATQSIHNLHLRAQLELVQTSLQQGSLIGEPLGELSAIDPLIAQMVKVGEKTGNLDEVLLYLADFYEDEIDTLSKNLITVIEPLLLLVIGAMVAFVALAIITPMYQITGSIRR